MKNQGQNLLVLVTLFDASSPLIQLHCLLQLKLVQYLSWMIMIHCWIYIAGVHICWLYSFDSDITALAKDKAYAQISLDEMSIHQALQLGQDASSPYGFFSGQRCQMCLRSNPLHKVIERLAIPGVRRLVIVEAGSKRVEGIVSLSDVFQFLLGC